MYIAYYTLIDPKDSDKVCNMQCTFSVSGGIVSYPCGGKNAYSVYKVEPLADYMLMNISREDKLDIMYASDKNICIKDNQYCGKRVLNGACYSANNNNVDECINYCAKGNFKYAGLEAGAQCFCGNDFDGLGSRIGLDHCSSSCFGNNSQICGGSWALSIHNVPNNDIGLKIGL